MYLNTKNLQWTIEGLQIDFDIVVRENRLLDLPTSLWEIFRVQVSDPRGRNPSETLERKIWDYGFLGLGPNQRTTDISETEWTFLR